MVFDILIHCCCCCW